MRLWILMVVALASGCGKTSSPTPESTGSGTVTTGGDHSAPAQPVVGSAAGSAPASNDPFERGVAALGALKAKMCACPDTACTTQVMEEYKAWRVAMKQETVGQRATEEQNTRANTLDKELRACRSTVDAKVGPGSAVGSGSGTGDPFEAALGELEGFKARMCTCADKACADKVQADVATWQRALRARLGTAKPSALQEARGKQLEKDTTACRQKAEAATPGAPAADKIDQLVARMQGFRDRLCACKDKACGEAVRKELATWQASLGKEIGDAKPTQAQDAAFDKLDAEVKACAAKL